MDTIEIRPKRTYLILFTATLVLGLAFMNYVTFFTDYYKGRSFIWKALSVLLSVSLIATIYKMYQQIKTNTPSIIMTGAAFIHYEKGKVHSYPWNNITSWHISKEDNTTYLVLEANGNKEKIPINWLDKTPEQIDELMQQFRQS